MIFYGVVQEYYDDWQVYAWITHHAGAEILPSRMETHPNKDVYIDYFTDKAEAIKFCDGALHA